MTSMRKLINLMEGVEAVPALNEYIRTDSPLRDREDYVLRMKELQKIQMDPATARDPRLKAELTRKKVMLDQQARELGIISERGEPGAIGIGAKVFLSWRQKGTPLEVIGMTQSGQWIVLDEFGKKGSVRGEDLVPASVDEDIEKPAQVVSCDQSNPAAARDACAMESMMSENAGPAVHQFGSTGEAYDATQMEVQIDDDGNEVPVHTGDILVIPSEGVVGISATWPIAITKEPGHLHYLEDQYHTLADIVDAAKVPEASVRKAVEVAKGLGFPTILDDQAMEEDINNGYDEVHYATGGDYFPNGADSPVVKATGPSGARQGDNPEQKKMQVTETHKELVYAYRNYLKESATSKTPKKKLNENAQPVVSNIELQDYVGDFDHDGDNLTYEGTIYLSANALGQNGQPVGIGFTLDVSVSAPYSWETDEQPTGYNYSNDTIRYSSSTYASAGDPVFNSIQLSNEEPIVTDNGDISVQDAQQLLAPEVFKEILNPAHYQNFFAKQFTAQAEKMEPPEPDFDEPDYDDRY